MPMPYVYASTYLEIIIIMRFTNYRDSAYNHKISDGWICIHTAIHTYNAHTCIVWYCDQRRRESFPLFSGKKNLEKKLSMQQFRAATECTIGNCIIIITSNCLIPIFYILRNSISSSSCYLSLVKLLNLHTQRKEAIFCHKLWHHNARCMVYSSALYYYTTTTTTTTGLVGYYSSTVRSIQW
jgi:hypothetical protein